jgi:hypothetical protein
MYISMYIIYVRDNRRRNAESKKTELEFLKSLWGLGIEEE